MRRIAISSWVVAGTMAAVLISGCHRAPSAESAAAGATKSRRASRLEQLSLQTKRIAEQGYVYGYPLVLMDALERQMTSAPEAGNGHAPLNQFVHQRKLGADGPSLLRRATIHTLHSSAWVDLGQGPVVLSVPAISGRFARMTIFSGWTNVVDSLGSQRTATPAANYVLTGPSWSGTIPSGMEEIKVPTAIAMITAEAEVVDAADLTRVHMLQDQVRLTTLSDWGKPSKAAPEDGGTRKQPEPKQPGEKTDDSPLKLAYQEVEALNTEQFMGRLAALLKSNPPANTDQPIVAALQSIGVTAGRAFSLAILGTDSKLVEDGYKAGKQHVVELSQHMPQITTSGEWQWPSMAGNYGGDYLHRAAVAASNLGLVPLNIQLTMTAIHAADGQPLNGDKLYRLHMARTSLPPVDNFWTVSAYTIGEREPAGTAQHHGVLNRDALHLNADGSLDVLLQRRPPAKEMRLNWVPVPEGDYELLLRLYAPRQEALNGTWTPPEIELAPAKTPVAGSSKATR